MKGSSIGYARKSICVQGLEDERESVLYQLNQIEEYTDENNLQLIHIYSDIGYSGVLKSRPELNKMLEFLRDYLEKNEEKVQYLIFYNQERLARDLSTSIELMLEITELVEEVVFVADETSTSIKNFRQQFLVKAAEAAENRRFIKKRLRQGRRAKVAYSNYYRSTYKPLGYVQPRKKELVLATDDQTRDQESNNDLIIVQSIFLAYLSGMSLRNIAEWLNTEFGLTKRGKQWSYKSVQYILKNPVYAGILSSIFMKHKEIKSVETIEPLVSPSLFEYVQRKLEQESSGNKRKVSKKVPDLSLCLQCLVPLETKGNQLRCPSCEGKISINLLTEFIKGHFIKLLKGEHIQQPHLNELLLEKKQHTDLHLYSLKNKLKSLRQRENEIQGQAYFQNEKLKRLLEANQNEQINIQQKLYLEEGFYEFLYDSLTEGDVRSNLERVQANGLMILPYLLLVDFSKKNIYVKYHQELFSQVIENDK